jgi:hypothetical protein
MPERLFIKIPVNKTDQQTIPETENLCVGGSIPSLAIPLITPKKSPQKVIVSRSLPHYHKKQGSGGFLFLSFKHQIKV